jgi:hypothetical protein
MLHGLMCSLDGSTHLLSILFLFKASNLIDIEVVRDQPSTIADWMITFSC